MINIDRYTIMLLVFVVFSLYGDHLDLHVLDTLFPYTTLFRSDCNAPDVGHFDVIGVCPKAVVRSIHGAIDLTVSSALAVAELRSEEHTSELQSLMRISYAVFCLK